VGEGGEASRELVDGTVERDEVRGVARGEVSQGGVETVDL